MMASRQALVIQLTVALVFFSSTRTGVAAERDEEARINFFEKNVRPLLAANCYNCHSANTNSRGGLRVDDRNGLVLGGDRGPAVAPGHPEKSLLIEAVRRTHAEVKMPPSKPLSKEQIAVLSQWIKEGAAWPKAHIPLSVGKYEAKYASLRQEHWAWQPLREPETPAVEDAAWPLDDLDRFILARLDEKGLTPVADADPLTLLRRLCFDLTGLPPTEALIGEFVEAGDTASAKRCAELVDRLLASPAFGERWGRHWLDVARYGESTGSSRNVPYPHAWRFRDYVIDAFNSDKPYDQFVREQIAGDLLPASSQKQRDAQLVATGFLAMGVRDVNQRFKIRFIMDNIDEQIDTVSRAFLGLTVSCARCHDHKFDPIPTTDYYALAGIFQSSDLCAGLRNKMGGGGLDFYDTNLLLRLGPDKGMESQLAAKIEQAKQQLADARKAVLAITENTEEMPGGERDKKLSDAKKRVAAMQSKLVALNDPAAYGPVALGARDGTSIGDAELRIRGEAEKLGPVVPRGFLTAFDVPNAPRITPEQSGRLQLAEWLASATNPLTARVMVNRIWRHLFGKGLVTSVDNFGVTGDAPSHPELLDHLATRFMKDGWSVKKLVRAIVLSRVYQLSAETSPAHLAVAPDNRLVWRHSPRRLDAEEIRDAMLTASGQLDLRRPAGSPVAKLKFVEIRNNGREAEQLEATALASKCRSIYLPLVRGMTPHALEVFDFAEQGMVTGSRDSTTVATQALYLLNDPFVRQQAKTLADRVHKRAKDDAGRVSLAYRWSLGRDPSDSELSRALDYMSAYEEAARGEQAAGDIRHAAWGSLCQALFASAEFRYIR